MEAQEQAAQVKFETLETPGLKFSRQCGSCTVCCAMLEVPEVKKTGEVCPNLCESGCSIHETKPDVCKNFSCGWIMGIGREAERPDKLGLMPAYNEEGSVLMLFESRKGAWDSLAGRMYLKGLKRHKNGENWPIQVFVARVVGQPIEYIGTFPPGERLVIEK